MSAQQQEAVQTTDNRIESDNLSNSALAPSPVLTRAPLQPEPEQPVVPAVADIPGPSEKQASTAAPEAPLLPPPRRTMTASPAPAARPSAPAQKSGFLRKLGDSKWGQRATKVSDAVGTRVNNVSEKVGVERFWPTTGDGYIELQKCERVLREFIVVGVPTKEKAVDESGKQKKKTKVLKKLPPSVLANAKGIVIFSAFRSGFAPLGGSGGSGVIMIRNPDRSWSAPAFIAPNNLSGGFLIGLDAFNAIIILNSDEAVQGFKSHQFTLGAEIGVVAGPLGAGAGVDSGLTAGSRGAPIYTYVASKGFYAGVELVGQVFVEREEENEIVYGRKGIRSIDILEGRVTPVPEAQPLHQLLRDAETGQAQGPTLERVVSEEAEKTPLA